MSETITMLAGTLAYIGPGTGVGASWLAIVIPFALVGIVGVLILLFLFGRSPKKQG